MDRVGKGAQPVGELFRVRTQPVADKGLPAVVDLEEVAGLEHLSAAVEIVRDRLGRDVLIAVIPARIPGQALAGARLYPHRGKPAVEYRVLTALGIE